MKHLIITFFSFTLLVCTKTFGQQNNLFIEAGGNGLFGSVNYERMITKEPGLSLRAGIGIYTEKAFYLTLPVGINYLFPLKKAGTYLDAGLGITWAQIDGKIFKDEGNANGDHFTNFIPSFGYRKHVGEHTMWRASITPVFNKMASNPWIGFSVGRRF
jgi:hypothetical protein